MARVANQASSTVRAVRRAPSAALPWVALHKLEMWPHAARCSGAPIQKTREGLVCWADFMGFWTAEGSTVQCEGVEAEPCGQAQKLFVHSTVNRSGVCACECVEKRGSEARVRNAWPSGSFLSSSETPAGDAGGDSPAALPPALQGDRPRFTRCWRPFIRLDIHSGC